MIKYLKIICSFLTLVLVLSVNAQQNPRFNTYVYNLSVVNPAVAGTGKGLELYGGIRNQWAGASNGPETHTFNINKKVKNRVGVGLNVVNDDVFIVSDVGVYFDFSYQLQLAENTDLFLGLKGGGSFLSIDFNRLEIEGDNLLMGNFSKYNPNVGVGAYMENEKYFISLSVPRLLKNDRFDEVQNSLADDRAHIFLGLGYVFNLSDSWDIKPQSMANAVSGAPLALDVTLLANYSDKFEFGTNYRFDESITGIATFVFSDYGKIGFSYEYATTDIQDFNNGSFEIFAKFNIGSTIDFQEKIKDEEYDDDDDGL